MRRNRGSALPAVLLLALAVTAGVVALSARIAATATDLRARYDVLCAAYGAEGGLAAGPLADGRPALIDARLHRLHVEYFQRSARWCVLRATAHCGQAERTRERQADPQACGAAGLRFRPLP